VSPTASPLRFRQSLLRLLESGPCEDDAVLARIEQECPPGQPLYSSILHLLTHLSFSEPQAKKHWERLLAHRSEMVARLGRDPGLRVALLDYFVNVSQELRSPKVVEISIFERTERRALTDGLTGLYNRSYFSQALRREIYRARRHALKVSLLLLDLDDFKRLNDTRGHVAGDRVLVRTAALVTQSMRQIDVCARYGGEEFAVILPDTDRDGAVVVADRIRARVSRQRTTVTLSGGVATFPDDALDPAQLLREADRLLYRAKADGKNCVRHNDPNRRRHDRHAVTLPVEVTVAPRLVIEGTVRNVSEGGVLLETVQAVTVGSRLGLTSRTPEGTPISVHGQVVRSERADDEHFALGLRLFSDPRRNRALIGLPSCQAEDSSRSHVEPPVLVS
jgi:diguanylate cyclase (GGDEF)-like protein